MPDNGQDAEAPINGTHIMYLMLMSRTHSQDVGNTVKQMMKMAVASIWSKGTPSMRWMDNNRHVMNRIE